MAADGAPDPRAAAAASDRDGELELDFVLERLDRVDSAVDQSLELIAAARSRLSAGGGSQTPLERETLDIVALVREVLDGCKERGARRHLHLEHHAPVLAGQWNGELLRTAIGNILDNAVKFSPEGADVHVRINRDDDSAVVEVEDQGLGIPARDVPHICERFYRAENVVGRYKGAGVGLFEARAAIARHDGSLVVKATEGSGTIISVHLPLR